MKRLFLFFSLSLVCLLLAACAAGSSADDLKVYHAKHGSLVNPNFPAYSFEYPSAWKIEEEANHITFASETALLKDAPKQLKAGQILAGLSMNVDMAPQEMIDSYTSTLGSLIQFEPVVSMIVNGQHAAYQSGTNSQTGDQTFVIATEIGGNLRGLLTARVAGSEMDQWKETLFRIAQSLALER